MRHMQQRSPWGGVTMLVFGLLVVMVAVWGLMHPRRVSPPPPPPLTAPVITQAPTNPSTESRPRKPPKTSSPEGCQGQAKRPFVPAVVGLEAIGRRTVGAYDWIRTQVDTTHVAISPAVPPVSDPSSFAWTRQSARVGAKTGYTVLTAHTYEYGQSLGRDLYEQVRPGDIVRVRSATLQLGCYQVSERLEVNGDAVRAAKLIERVFTEDTHHYLVMFVCSGERLGPGKWSHTTALIAQPV